MTQPLPNETPVFHPELLAGRCALVTGGGTGLGRAIARELAAAGADLFLAARRPEPLEETAQALRTETGRQVEIATANIRDRESVEALAHAVSERFGQADILVNNAGGQFPAPARTLKPKGWHSVIDTNLNGTWNMTQVFGDQMLSGRGGTIVNIIAVVGRGFPGLVHTAAARAGVAEMTRTLAYEWGEKVRVNCVAPGPIQTQGFDEAYDPRVKERMRLLPMQRMGRARETALAVAFLASPAASFITGETLFVAGGQQNYGPNQALGDRKFERS